MFSLKGILLLALFIFLPIVKRTEGVYSSRWEGIWVHTQCGVNLWLFSACHSLNVRNRCSDQFTALSEPQAGRKRPVTDLLWLGENEYVERLPQLMLRKWEDSVRTFFPFTDGSRLSHPGLLRTVPIYACYSGVIINSIPIYSQNHSCLDNKVN